jgi:hypothetical protein
MSSPFFHIPDPTYNRCIQIVNNAVNAWHNLVVTIAAENVAMGITQQGKTKLIADIMMPIMMYGQTGSLWQAYEALGQLKITPDMAPFITEARRAWMKDELIRIMSTL